VAGVTGARAAGMTVLGFHGGSHCGAGHAEDASRRGRPPGHSTDMRQLPMLVAVLKSASCKMAD